MAKQFSVPPVVFPQQQQQRRPPPSAPPLPFMSFDIPSTTTTTGFGVGSSTGSGFGSGSGSGFGFDDEPPLLEELGINTRQIWLKTLSILNPLRLNPSLFHDDADLSGPFLFLLSFGLFQLLAGKFHFGIILGWVTVASLFLYVVFNMIAGRSGNIDLYRCVSLVGYGMLPMVLFSACSLFVPRAGFLVFGLGMVFVVWSTRVCTGLLVELSASGDDHRLLIGYACWLVYMLFSLLIIF